MSTYYLFSQRHLYPSPSGGVVVAGAAQTEPSLFLTLTARLKFIAVPCAPRRGARPYGVAFVCRSFLPNQPGHTLPPNHPPCPCLSRLTVCRMWPPTPCAAAAPPPHLLFYPKCQSIEATLRGMRHEDQKYIDISRGCKLCPGMCMLDIN